VPLRRALELVGLVDVENRRKDKRNVPPTAFYARARREIAVSALSAKMTFEMQTPFILERLEEGIRVRILLLHPDSPDVDKLEVKVNQAIRADILTSIDFIKRYFHRHDGFRVRFAGELAPFTAAMIDGDVDADRRTRRDAGGVIRIQPGVVHERPHHGLILQLVEIPDGMFQYFADDLSAQWHAAVEDPGLFGG
jgi:hypothetical protein